MLAPEIRLLDFLQGNAEASLQITLSLCLRLRHISVLLSDMAFLDLLSRPCKRLCEAAGILQETTVEVNVEVPVVHRSGPRA